MYIEPNTTVKLLHKMTITPDYEHTMFFGNKEQQYNFFSSPTYVKYTLTNQSYQRYKKGIMRVAYKAEDLYDCNYMMFQNTSFGSKWFYAFIKSVTYVNNITSEIEYEIDVMQTWFFDYELQHCFVEREHSKTDNVGDNLVNEDLHFGPYVYERANTFNSGNLSLEDLSVVIMYNPALFDPINLVSGIEDFRYTENFYSGVYQGVRFIAIPAIRANASALETLISSTDFLSSGGFLSAFIMPSMFLPDRTGTLSDGIEYNKKVSLYVNRPTQFGSYTPKNNKLFTYPYTCAYLTSMRGKGNEFPFEYFAEDGKALFYAEGNLSSNPSVMAYPFGYKGVAQYLEGAVSIDSYPICTWGADGVTEWINNNLFKSLASIGTTLAVGGILPASAVKPTTTTKLATSAGVKSTIGLATSAFEPGSVHGGANGDILIGNISGRHIYGMVERITDQFAEIIDNYFTRYGYACHKVKIPNRNVRKQYTYTKTLGCTIKPTSSGSVPADDAKKICEIYDNGITFWKYASIIGNYTGDNSPL